MAHHVYECRTGDVIVRVEPDYLAEESDPKDERYVWAYTVEIINKSDKVLQIVEREWNIADSRGRNKCVRGQGVVGEKPVLQPGDVFRYTSGAPLNAPSGMMHGLYRLQDEEGEKFDIDIPPFILDSPYESGLLN